jgi:NAD(P)H-hydrate epimerase
MLRKYHPDTRLPVMSADQVRAVDAWAIQVIGAPGLVLMENAGRSCAELIREKLAHLDSPAATVFSGTGNNGGDGYVIARHLLNAGYSVRLALCGDPEEVTGDAKVNLDILRALNQKIDHIDTKAGDAPEKVRRLAENADVLVDAIFGTGLSGNLREDYHRLVDAINEQQKTVLAVDIPSGLDCDTGTPLGTAVKATWTVTFVAVKKGFVTSETAADYTGEIYLASIGVEPAFMQSD